MERTRNYDRTFNEISRGKMAGETEFGTRKTVVVFGIVFGCLAILGPRIFYPMFIGPNNPNNLQSDGPVCCDLIFESDVNTADILHEMCKNILKHHQVDPRVRDAVKMNKLSSQSASFCREEVLARCGIDLSSFLAEKERLGKTNKQVLEEIRSFNSSICLKVHFGVPLSQLGIPHLIRYHILMPHTPIRQERNLPPHAGGLHPAMRERGRAIPSSHIVPRVDGRPEQVIPQKMRPPMGGPGRVVPPQGTSSTTMGLIMPLYTVGILLFFVYTIAKILRKSSNNEIYPEYIRDEAEREFRDRVFNPEVLSSAITGVSYSRQRRSQSPPKRLSTVDELRQQAAGDIEVDQLIQRLADTEAAMERIVVQMGNLSRTVKQNPSSQPDIQGDCSDKNCYGFDNNIDEELDDSSPTVKVMGMETTACCEGGQKISRPTTPIIPPHPQSTSEREKTPPKPIYLEGALPSQCELLVTDSETQAENVEEDAEAAVVLSGKMTLSLISLDQTPANSEETNGDIEENEEITEVAPESHDKILVELEEDGKLVREQIGKEIRINDEDDDEDEEEIDEDAEEEHLDSDDQEDADSEESEEDEVIEKNVRVREILLAEVDNDKQTKVEERGCAIEIKKVEEEEMEESEEEDDEEDKAEVEAKERNAEVEEEVEEEDEIEDEAEGETEDEAENEAEDEVKVGGVERNVEVEEEDETGDEAKDETEDEAESEVVDEVKVGGIESKTEVELEKEEGEEDEEEEEEEDEEEEGEEDEEEEEEEERENKNEVRKNKVGKKIGELFKNGPKMDKI